MEPDIGRGDHVPVREETVPHPDQGALRLAELADAAEDSPVEPADAGVIVEVMPEIAS